MIDIPQLRQHVIDPTLQQTGLYSLDASQLLIATALIESRLTYLHQIEGSALAIMQIESSTYQDLKLRVGRYHNEIYQKILKVLNMSILPSNPYFLCGNLTASVIFARLKYYLDPRPLPKHDDFAAIANYHKDIYNTNLGKTDPLESIELLQTYKTVLLNI